jgi:hypothetical protein
MKKIVLALCALVLLASCDSGMVKLSTGTTIPISKVNLEGYAIGQTLWICAHTNSPDWKVIDQEKISELGFTPDKDTILANNGYPLRIIHGTLTERTIR